MKRVVDVDIEVKTKDFNKALNKFLARYPYLEGWRETFEWMHSEGEDFFSDNTLSDGSKNENWTYALHLDENENSFYFAVLERE